MKNRDTNIRLATTADLPLILPIYNQARRYMVVMGNPTQWGYYYPEATVTEADIAQQQCYVVEDKADGTLLGVFVWQQGPYAPYDTITHGKWLNEVPYGVLLRMASAGLGGGVADVVLDWLKAKGGDIRVDTHRDNHAMRQALTRHGFRLCGSVEIREGEHRIAFQWRKPTKPALTPEAEAQRAADYAAFLARKAEQAQRKQAREQAREEAREQAIAHKKAMRAAAFATRTSTATTATATTMATTATTATTASPKAPTATPTNDSTPKPMRVFRAVRRPKPTDNTTT